LTPNFGLPAFTHVLLSRWMFVSQTVPCDRVIFQPFEDVIRQVFILTLTGCPPPCDNLRQLFALPARYGAWVFLFLLGQVTVSLRLLIVLLNLFACAFIIALSFQQSGNHSVCKARLESYYNGFTELRQ